MNGYWEVVQVVLVGAMGAKMDRWIDRLIDWWKEETRGGRDRLGDFFLIFLFGVERIGFLLYLGNVCLDFFSLLFLVSFLWLVMLYLVSCRAVQLTGWWWFTSLYVWRTLSQLMSLSLSLVLFFFFCGDQDGKYLHTYIRKKKGYYMLRKIHKQSIHPVLARSEKVSYTFFAKARSGMLNMVV